jgi:hypothetical protein
MYSRYSDLILKNGMWRKTWIRDIEGILMMLKGNILKNGAKEELPRIEPLTSRFPHSDLDLDFYARKLKYINIVKRFTVLMHTIIYYYH